MHVEIGILSVEDAIAAQNAGADGVELLDNVGEGGVTPSAGKIAACREVLNIEFNVIIRPRPRDFFYSDAEFDVMRRDVQVAKDLGVDGVVLGMQNADGTVDARRIAQLVALARPMRVTHHAAFDYTPDPFAAIDALIGVDVDRILSAFHGGVVLLDNLDLYRKLIAHTGDRAVFLPGGLWDAKQAARVKAELDPREIHIFNAVDAPSAMAYRPAHVRDDDLLMRGYTVQRVDEQVVRDLIAALR